MAVFVEFGSGLGNQLFQFAAGYSVARRHGIELVADLWKYQCAQKQPRRGELRQFLLHELGFPMEFRKIPRTRSLSIRGYPRLRSAWLNRKLERYECMGTFSNKFLELPKNSLLSGYFQDFRYFSQFHDEIVSLVYDRLSSVAPPNFTPISEGWGAVHVRRGDYLCHSELYPDWFEEYSREAVRLLLTRYSCEKVVVFTDDQKWVEKHLCLKDNRIFIAKNPPSFQGALDLLQMSTAKVVAIANSTFSWWAGAIVSQRGGTVIAPSKWSEWCQSPEECLVMPGWVKLGCL
jgi:hypothetical protein